MMKTTLAAVAISAFAATSAHAQDVRFGVEGGLAGADLGGAEAAQVLATASGRTVTFSEDGSTGALRAYAELGVTDTLAVEFGLFQTGSMDVTFASPGTTATGRVEVDARGFDFGLKYYATDTVFLRAGAHYSELSATGTVTIAGVNYGATVDEDGFGGFLGAGVYLTDNISVGLTYYDSIGGTSDADATFAFIGYRF
ncbi:MAG: hypothetical protein ACMUJJ_00045 [Roseicyclus sp.]|uniref:hypothetical protein n=1 Tax=Roseicyclus sp. TaxID=1914329 RepID=UPI003A848FE4